MAPIENNNATEDVDAQILVFSVAGRIGSGASFVARNLRDELYAYRYDVTWIDMSVVIKLAALSQLPSETQDEEGLLDDIEERFNRQFESAEERTRVFQDTGNSLRESFGNDILARHVVTQFINPLLRNVEGVAKRRAFIVDSLKRPEEVQLFRKIFGNAYFAVGVVSTDAKRLERLRERKGYSKEVFDQISERDREERESDSGQRAVDTVLKSDYFFANNYSTKEKLRPEIARFVNLVFNASMITPRRDEFAMNVAFKSAARSACLSRQVGSAILDSDGHLLATGCNDVPKFGGGLYSSEDEHDRRCWSRGGKCYNDEEKSLIVRELVDSLMPNELLEKLLVAAYDKSVLEVERANLRDQFSTTIRKSRIRQLIEFTRAVHAEMDAIMSIARTGKPGLVGSTLYCTTYPCHNCAKHIIDAGIKRLVYLEPYEKSLARKLHEDAINDSSEDGEDRFVVFQLYNGVAPGRYAEFFDMQEDRKADGRYIDRSDTRADLLPSRRENADELWRRIEKYGSQLNNGVTHEPTEQQPVVQNSGQAT